jgi:hypothetical protein
MSRLIAISDNVVKEDPEIISWELKMSELNKSGQFGSSTQHNEATLPGLYQIDIDENIPLEEEALVIMVKLLYNLEELKKLRDNRRKIVVQGELIETRLLSLLKVLRTHRARTRS